MKILLTFLFLLSGLTVQAQSSCLQNATNNELIRELSRRLNNNPGVTPIATLSAACDNSNWLQLSLIEMQTGKIAKFGNAVGLDCNDYANSIAHVTNYGLSQNLIISYCDGSQWLHKVLVNVNTLSISEVSSAHVGMNCKKQALDANSKLQAY